MSRVVLSLLGYLLGSFPSAVLGGRLLGVDDIREYGSKNMGTFNALRVAGKKAALITLVLDVGKGALAAALGSFWGGGFWAAYFALLGHILPIYVGFRGGKGLAVYVGALSILRPEVLIFLGITFPLLYGILKRVALCTVLSFSILLPLFIIVYNGHQSYFIFALLSGLTIGIRQYQDLVKEVFET